ncbi:hypothetical protein PGTUg99_031383 [Puccinia graminis f. sp. tritici]|uniref:Uncharacterized protein n=1 Tax=Puccinia graminis f. sp. tritici TaxID=56615 RepID=A0A5B0P2K5_PUCGR|nr:hypothetical protein PGTUg99_031383 [Puccinia graminis f. sp. tritici]
MPLWKHVCMPYAKPPCLDMKPKAVNSGTNNIRTESHWKFSIEFSGAPARQEVVSGSFYVCTHPRVNADSKFIEQAGPTPARRDCVRPALHPAGPRNRLNTLQLPLGLGFRSSQALQWATRGDSNIDDS